MRKTNYASLTHMISIRRFARKLGVSEGAVRAAIKSGRVPADAIGSLNTKTGRMRPAIADENLAARAFAPDSEPLPADVLELRRYRDRMKAARAAAQMIYAMSRDMLQNGQLVGRGAIYVAVKEIEEQMIGTAPTGQRAQVRRVLREFIGKLKERVATEPSSAPRWPTRPEAARWLWQRIEETTGKPRHSAGAGRGIRRRHKRA
jgi:hypothetical protein